MTAANFIFPPRVALTRQPPEEKLEGGDGTIDDLKQALVENLEHRGVLGKIRANVRPTVDRGTPHRHHRMLSFLASQMENRVDLLRETAQPV